MNGIEKILAFLSIVGPVVSATLVALLNNWDKINPSRKHLKEVLKTINDTQNDVSVIKAQMKNLSSAQKAALQTQILEKCRRIQIVLDAGSNGYEEDLKQLIILYREYRTCGFNCQGKIYFDSTIKKAAECNNLLVHELMNQYFSDYDPNL